MKIFSLIAVASLLAACSTPQSSPVVGMANPASQYCIESGGTLRIENKVDGQIGICVYPDGREVEEWELFRSSKKSAEDKVNVVRYACGNGERITVRFFLDKELAILERGDTEIELPQQRSGSGIRYSNGPNTIYGKGGDLTLEIGRMAPIECKAV